MQIAKTPIDPFECAEEITKALSKGALFTTKAQGRVNTMVIGWGLLGTVWTKPTLVAFIRMSRESCRMVEESGCFTVNIADGPLDKEIMRVAGTMSARHVDKIAELGLTLVDAEAVDAPAILECPLTLECKVMYEQMLIADSLPADVRERFYPEGVFDPDELGNSFMHIAYYGEIVSAYRLG